MSKSYTTANFLEKKIVFIVSAFLFKLILEFTYTEHIYPIFGPSFKLDFTLLKYFESWLIYLLFMVYTPHLLRQTSDIVINMLFFNFLSPLLIFYSFNNSHRAHLYIVLFGILIIYLFRKGFKINFPLIKQGHIYSSIICYLGVLIVNAWLIFSGGINHFNLDMLKVYDFREGVSALIDIGIMSYLNSWSYKVFGPFLLIYFLHKKNNFFALLIIFLHMFWYGVTSLKSVFFTPFIILFIYFFFRVNRGLSIIPILFILLISSAYLSFFVSGELFYTSFAIRRLFFVPSYLTFSYYEFFSSKGFIYWSNSLLSGFIDYPYNLRPEKLIGLEFVGPNASANNSFLSTGFMHAGISGVLIYSMIFVAILKLIDNLKINPNNIWVSTAIIFLPIRTLIIGSDLFSSLLTHGILMSLILLFFSRIKFIS